MNGIVDVDILGKLVSPCSSWIENRFLLKLKDFQQQSELSSFGSSGWTEDCLLTVLLVPRINFIQLYSMGKLVGIENGSQFMLLEPT